jgi:tetratricopeptide (TPR) repeat protein
MNRLWSELSQLAAFAVIVQIGSWAGLHEHTALHDCMLATFRPTLEPATLQTQTAAAVEMREWAKIAEKLEPGMVLLATHDGFGTGFVISKEHRLVVTAAHIADNIPDGKSAKVVSKNGPATYSVDRAWYHPRVERKVPGSLPAPSEYPGDGPIASCRFDVAVIRLAPDGPELTAEWKIAGDDELADLVGRRVGCVYYAAKQSEEFHYDGSQMVPLHFTPSTVVARTVAVDDPAIALDSQISIDALLGSGSSGSPIFLPNGRVIGVISAERSTRTTQMYLAAKVTALRELIAYHRLASLMPALDSPVSPESIVEQRLRIENLRRAVQLSRDAETLRRAGQYGEAADKCNEARRIVPDYGGVLLARSKVYLYYLATQWHSLTDENRRQFAEWAVNDASVFVATYSQQAEGILIQIQAGVYLARSYDTRAGFVDELEALQWLLQNKEFVVSLTPHELAFACNLRAQCYHFLGEMEKAEAGYDQSISVERSDARWFLNRAQFWDQRGKRELAEYDRQMAQALRLGGPLPKKVVQALPLPPLPSPANSPFGDAR